MPRNQGTSRKGKPKKHERMAGMGRALQRAQHKPHISKPSKGGMAMTPGVESIGNDKAGLIDVRASVLEMNDLDDFLIQAEMANREFASEKEQLVVLDSNTTVPLSEGEMALYHNNYSQPKSISWGDEEEVGQPSSRRPQGGPPSSFVFQELSVPRRPAWTKETTPQELDIMERESFLEWRRGIAIKEEQIMMMQTRGSSNKKGDFSSNIMQLGVTPFEKNIEIWRQLWRVMERCSCIVQIVDARNPLFYLSKDLKQYATKELNKPMVLLINKSDYLTSKQRQAWHEYLSSLETDLNQQQWHHIFFSAHEEQKRLDDEASARAKAAAESILHPPPPEIDLPDDDNDEDDDQEEDDDEEEQGDVRDESIGQEGTQLDTNANVEVPKSDNVTPKYDNIMQNVGIDRPLSREDLLDWLHTFAIQNKCQHDPRHTERIPFGMVGFPNVGKSSVINVLMGNTKNAHGVVRVGVAAQPGKTKHFQTLLLPERDDVLLCDCPGLVFPSFVNNTADLIAAGVYPIAQMRDHTSVLELVCQRIPRQVLNARYGIQIPLPGPDRMAEYDQRQQQMHSGDNNAMASLPPPTAAEFLSTYCAARSIADEPRAARIIIKDYAAGKLLYCHAPPSMAGDEATFYSETLITAMNSTKKLRDKLHPAHEDEELHDESHEQDEDFNGDDDVDGRDEDDVEDDDLMLELMDEVAGESKTTNTGNRKANKNRRDDDDKNGKKNHHSRPARGKKWGKKGKKLRNSDPYGCHSSPDDMLSNSTAASGGVIVKGGKYGSSGYTRPVGYGGPRSAV